MKQIKGIQWHQTCDVHYNHQDPEPYDTQNTGHVCKWVRRWVSMCLYIYQVVPIRKIQ